MLRDPASGDETGTAVAASPSTSDKAAPPQRNTNDSLRKPMPPPDRPLGPLNETYKFFLANLPPSVTPHEMRVHFEKFGKVNYVKLVYNKDTGISMGYGFLYLMDAETDRRVQEYATSNNFRIQFASFTRIYLNRNDPDRVRPSRKFDRGPMRWRDERRGPWRGPPRNQGPRATPDRRGPAPPPNQYRPSGNYSDGYHNGGYEQQQGEYYAEEQYHQGGQGNYQQQKGGGGDYQQQKGGGDFYARDGYSESYYPEERQPSKARGPNNSYASSQQQGRPAAAAARYAQGYNQGDYGYSEADYGNDGTYYGGQEGYYQEYHDESYAGHEDQYYSKGQNYNSQHAEHGYNQDYGYSDGYGGEGHEASYGYSDGYGGGEGGYEDGYGPQNSGQHHKAAENSNHGGYSGNADHSGDGQRYRAADGGGGYSANVDHQNSSAGRDGQHYKRADHSGYNGDHGYSRNDEQQQQQQKWSSHSDSRNRGNWAAEQSDRSYSQPSGRPRDNGRGPYGPAGGRGRGGAQSQRYQRRDRPY